MPHPEAWGGPWVLSEMGVWGSTPGRTVEEQEWSAARGRQCQIWTLHSQPGQQGTEYPSSVTSKSQDPVLQWLYEGLAEFHSPPKPVLNSWLKLLLYSCKGMLPPLLPQKLEPHICSEVASARNLVLVLGLGTGTPLSPSWSCCSTASQSSDGMGEGHWTLC